MRDPEIPRRDDELATIDERDCWREGAEVKTQSEDENQTGADKGMSRRGPNRATFQLWFGDASGNGLIFERMFLSDALSFRSRANPQVPTAIHGDGASTVIKCSQRH